MITKTRKVFDLRYMVKGHVYLLRMKLTNGSQEAFGILRFITPTEAIFVTIHGDIKITPEELEKEMDIKEVRIRPLEEDET